MLDNKMFKKIRLENFNWSCRTKVDHRPGHLAEGHVDG